MTKTTELAPDQIAAMPRYVEKWLNIGLCAQPANRDGAEKAIHMMYAGAGLPAPKILWAYSPLSGSIVVQALKDSVRASVGASVRASVRDSVWDSVWASVRDSVWDSVWDSVGASVGASVRDSVWDSVGASVRDSVGASVRGHHEAGWLSFYDYFRSECGLIDETEKLSGLLMLAQTCGWIFPYENICIATERSTACTVDAQGLLHSETGPAIVYQDGFAVHAWHGVRVPAEWIEKRDTIDPAEVLATRNVEQRAAGISIFGMARMLDKLDHKIIDSDPDPLHGDLIEIRIPDLPDPVLYLKAHCPRNGTIMEAVNPAEMDERTVKGAQAWRLGIPASEFIYPTVRT